MKLIYMKRNWWLTLAVVMVAAVLTLAAATLIVFVVAILRYTLQAAQFEPNNTIPITLCLHC